MGDAEYIGAIASIAVPIVQSFRPDLVIVSAGFNASENGFSVSSAGAREVAYCQHFIHSFTGYANMTKLLMSASDNRVVLVLEGGCVCVGHYDIISSSQVNY